MIKLKHFFVFFLLIPLNFSSLAVIPDGITENIDTAIRTGNAESLSKFFNSSLQLKTESQRQVYSKRQAKAILDDFFSLNRPIDYNVSGTRKAGSQKTVIGMLKTQSSNYRFLYRVSKYGGQEGISYIEIERM